MDWNIFWSAFGAIGTTVGSLVTAIAVLVALRQYKQPLLKKIDIEFTPTIADLGDGVRAYFTITVINRGVRPCRITSLWLKGKTNNMYLNNAQVKGYGRIEIPFVLQQEETSQMFFNSKALKEELQKFYMKEWIPNSRKLKIYAKDSTGDEYCGKTNIVVNKFLK